MKSKSRGKTNRRKGHDLERFVRTWLQKLGFKQARTTRQASRQLDNCAIDISFSPDNNFFPMLIQCKAGFERPRIKPDVEIRKIKDRIKDEFGKDHPIHDAPIVVMNKIDGYKPERFLVTMSFEDFNKILEKCDYANVVLSERN